MTEFDPEKFEAKYVHYFEELESAYTAAYQELHGEVDSGILRPIDRRVLSGSEPFYEGDGEFRVELPDDPYERAGQPGDREQFEAVLDDLVAGIERELRTEFGFTDAAEE
ncbi:DUF5783 family protein [Haloglomus halophilum]|uniref:DUF5783 family protein n=1 Tax=Haloglomus halophilum TaxID=2962672 RepID=UPI0020C9B7F6|nr:DUF5783 family protein [Haloglomus halophilum]